MVDEGIGRRVKISVPVGGLRVCCVWVCERTLDCLYRCGCGLVYGARISDGNGRNHCEYVMRLRNRHADVKCNPKTRPREAETESIQPSVQIQTDEPDIALKVYWTLVQNDCFGVTLDEPTLKPFEDLVRHHSDLFSVTSERKVFQASTYPYNKALIGILDKIAQVLLATWTFTYPVPRDVFLQALAVCEPAKKLPPYMGLESKYAASICCLLPDFEVTPNTVRCCRPAPRLVSFSSNEGNFDARDAFYDLIGLIVDVNGIDANLVLRMFKMSDKSVLQSFHTVEDIGAYLAHNLPDQFVLDLKRLKVIIPEENSGGETALNVDASPPVVDSAGGQAAAVMDAATLELSLPTAPPASTPLAVADSCTSAAGSALFGPPLSPYEVLEFFGVRLRAYEKWPACREFGAPHNPGVPLDWLVTEMQHVFRDNDHWKQLCREFIESYEGFDVRGERVFPSSPATILYPWDELTLLVFIEDVCKRLRRLVGLSTKIHSSLCQLKKPTTGRKLRLATIPTQLSLGLPRRREVPPDVPRAPLTALIEVASKLPSSVRTTLGGVFPGESILRDLPLLSMFVSHPILTLFDQWVLA